MRCSTHGLMLSVVVKIVYVALWYPQRLVRSNHPKTLPSNKLNLEAHTTQFPNMHVLIILLLTQLRSTFALSTNRLPSILTMTTYALPLALVAPPPTPI